MAYTRLTNNSYSYSMQTLGIKNQNIDMAEFEIDYDLREYFEINKISLMVHIEDVDDIRTPKQCIIATVEMYINFQQQPTESELKVIDEYIKGYFTTPIPQN